VTGTTGHVFITTKFHMLFPRNFV